MQTTIRMTAELFKAIDKARGDVPRERWIRRVLAQEVGFTGETGPTALRRQTEGDQDDRADD